MASVIRDIKAEGYDIQGIPVTEFSTDFSSTGRKVSLVPVLVYVKHKLLLPTSTV